MYSILQISDLHRSQAEPIDNDTLLSALLADRDRYAMQLGSPSAIVVSGDIVQGVRLGENDWDQKMKSQYEMAADFIGRLCDELLNGDRSQVAIIPGNHDVCWNTSDAAFEKVPKDQYPPSIPSELANPGTLFRWSWKELELYKLKDASTYKRRLSAYWDFFEKFYENTKLPMPVDRDRGYHFFELIGKRIFLAGFESTFGNDNFQYSGALTPGVIGRCAMEMRKIQHSYDLRLAIWHHSIYGPPNRNDYLDVNATREMAGHGFQLGLHGHQHVAESGFEKISLGAGQSMAVVSAGSLCAGWNDLPRGINRQYNVICLDENMASGSLHVREMIEGNQFTQKTNGLFLEGNIPLEWSAQLNAVGEPKNVEKENLRRLIENVERDIQKNEQSQSTSSLLLAKPASGTYGHKILLRVLVLEERWQDIKNFVPEPSSVEEYIAVIKATIEMKELDDAQALLQKSNIPESLLDELQTRIDMKKILG